MPTPFVAKNQNFFTRLLFLSFWFIYNTSLPFEDYWLEIVIKINENIVALSYHKWWQSRWLLPYVLLVIIRLMYYQRKSLIILLKIFNLFYHIKIYQFCFQFLNFFNLLIILVAFFYFIFFSNTSSISPFALAKLWCSHYLFSIENFVNIHNETLLKILFKLFLKLCFD